MGTLRYAILGLLNRRDMSGYDLTKEFETTLAEFWGAKHSQIYPELKALADEGLIAYQIEISGTVLEKKVYSITERGRTALQTWAETQLKIKSVPKDEFRLQLYFSDCIPPRRRIALLEPQLEQHRALLNHLRENLAGLGQTPPEDEAAFSDYLVLLGGVMREEGCCAWLERCIALCRERLEKQ